MKYAAVIFYYIAKKRETMTEGQLSSIQVRTIKTVKNLLKRNILIVFVKFMVVSVNQFQYQVSVFLLNFPL